MSQEFEDRCPVDLDLIDVPVVSVDIERIMVRGQKMRRNRKVLGAGAVGTLGVMGLAVACVAAPHGPASVSTAAGNPSLTKFEASAVVTSHPPVGGHVTMLGAHPGENGSTVSTVAWLSGKDLCFGATDLASGADTSVTCGMTPSQLAPANGPVVVTPVFVAASDANGEQPAIGFVHGDIKKVTLIFRGREYQATVTALAESGEGSYVVWLPSAGQAVTSQDFSAVTGYAGNGAVAARTSG